MSTPHIVEVELAHESDTNNRTGIAPPWSLFTSRGWISLREVNLRTGAHFLAIYRLLVQLEQLTEPRAIDSKSAGMAGIAQFFVPQKKRLATWLIEDLERIEADSKDLGLAHTTKRVERFRAYVGANATRLMTDMDVLGDARVQSEIRVLREALDDDLDERMIFFPISTNSTSTLRKLRNDSGKKY